MAGVLTVSVAASSGDIATRVLGTGRQPQLIVIAAPDADARTIQMQ